MHFQPYSRFFLLLVLAAILLSAGCNVPTQPAAVPTTAPTAAEAVQQVPTESVNKSSDTFTDPEAFKPALLQALMDNDVTRLQGWMSAEFLTGWWRADGSFTSPADGLQMLYANYLGADNHLEWVKDADVKALLGGTDPLSFGRSDSGLIEAALASGFGKGGRDEVVFLIARQADNSLKWYGWMYIQGGMSGARLGGNQNYTNGGLGISMYLPKDDEIVVSDANHVMIMGPGEGHPGPGRAAAFIEVVPADGRTVQEITDQVKADAGPGYNIIPTMMGLDKAPATVLDGLPGQDTNRQLFVVYNDLLYHLTFVPNNPVDGAAYQHMEDLYAMMVNTFHFTN